jgi:hypothetical protein
MEVRLPNKNKKNIIILSILAFVFLASGIYLLWRVNQPETVAPEEGEAVCDCPDGYTYFAMDEDPEGYLYCVDNSWKETMPGACYKPVTNCTPPGYSGGRGWVSADCISPTPPSPPPLPDYCVAEYPAYNALPYTTTAASKKSELILYYQVIPPYTALAQFVITDPDGQDHTITASSTKKRIATGIILEAGEKATVKAVYETAGGKAAVGWQPVNPGNTCGSGVMGPPQNNDCKRYEKKDVSSYISWADSSGDETLISRQCWADAKEWEGDYDFNDFFVQFYYLPIVSPPPPVCDGGDWDTNGKPSGVYPYCSDIAYSFVAKDADGVDKSSIIVKVNNDVRVNASKATIKTGDKEIRVKETLSTETNCLEPGDYTISAVWKDVKGAGGVGTACALATSFTVAEEIKNPDWNITKIPAESCIDDNTENPKAKLEYTITIKNTGEGSGEITSIVDTLDSKVLETYIENISSNGKFAGGKISWTLTGTDGQFTPGQSKTYTYSLLIPKDAFGTYDNTVTAVPSEGNSLIANASVTADCIVQESQEPEEEPVVPPEEPEAPSEEPEALPEEPEAPPEEPETPPEEPLPETGIFDNSQNTLLAGFGLLILGFTWRIFGKGIFVSIEFLGKVPKKISIQMRDIKEDIRAKKRIKEMKIADKRKKDFERKVVKD